MNNIELFIRNIESFGQSLSELGFSKGASEEQIKEVEKIIKRSLPEDFKLFLKEINGQKSDKLYLLPDEALLFSCDEIISEYKEQSDFFEDSIEFYNEFQDLDKIRCTFLSESRIPIAGRDGYFLFLDFDPVPNGTIGQVIFLINECDFVVLASNFNDFLYKYNDLMKNNILQIKEISNGQNNKYRLTNQSDFLNGIDFAKVFE